MKKFEYKIQIRESLLDVYGHVNNAAYVTRFEECRWEFVSTRGCGVNEVMKMGVGPIILSLKCNFRKELKAREKVTITLEQLNFRHKVGKLRQQIIKENGDVACEAEFEFGVFDMQKRRLVEPDEKWRYALAIDESTN